MMVFKKIPDELDSYEGEIIVAVVGRDERPLKATNAWIDWRLYGSLSQTIYKGLFTGEVGEKMMVPTYGRFQFDRLVLIGGGDLYSHEAMPQTEEGQALWRKISDQIAETVESLKVKTLGLSLPRYEVADQERSLLKTLEAAHLPAKTSLFLSRVHSQSAIPFSTMTA